MADKNYKNLDWFLERIGKTIYCLTPKYLIMNPLSTVYVSDRKKAYELYRLSTNGNHAYFESHIEFRSIHFPN
jgi:hypothetical protein